MYLDASVISACTANFKTCSLVKSVGMFVPSKNSQTEFQI